MELSEVADWIIVAYGVVLVLGIFGQLGSWVVGAVQRAQTAREWKKRGNRAETGVWP